MSDIVAQLARVSSALGISVDMDRAISLSRRLEGEPCVAILGLVSRGKSHLVNELIGHNLCPVGPLGETAATVRISAGPPSAWVEDGSGRRVELDPSPEALAARLPRRVTPVVVNAEFRGLTRLPEAVVIADTPGVDDAATIDARLAYLERHWLQAGSCGAVLVVSQPPGLGRTDASFIDDAKRIFDRNLVIAVKATDSSVENADLRAVAEEVRRHTGIDPIVIPNDEAVGNWGTGKTGELDRAITRLLTIGRRSRDVDSDALADLVRSVCETIRSVGTHRFAALDALSRDREITSVPLSRAIADRRREIQEATENEARLAREKAERERLAFLDSQAHQLRKLLPKKLASAERQSHGDAFRSIVDLAREGSPAALAIVAELMSCEPHTREQLGISIKMLGSKLGFSLLVEALGKATLSISELEALVGLVRSDHNVDALVRRTTFLKSLSHAPVRDVATFASGLTTWALRDAVRPVFIASMEKAMPSLMREAATPWTIPKVYEFWNGLVPLLNATEPMVPRTESRAQIDAISASLNAVVAQLFRAAVSVLADNERSATRDPSWLINESHSGWMNSTIIAECAGAAEWLQSNHVTDRAIDAFLPGGSIEVWAGQVMAARDAAVVAAARSSSRYVAAYVASFWLWGISVLMLLSGDERLQGVSPLVWLVSLTMWLVSRNRRVISWRMRFLAPVYAPLRR